MSQLVSPSQICQLPSWSSWTDSKGVLGLTNSRVSCRKPWATLRRLLWFVFEWLFWLNGLPCYTQCSDVVAFVYRIITGDLCLHAHTTVSSAFCNDNSNCSENKLRKITKEQIPKTHKRNRESIFLTSLVIILLRGCFLIVFIVFHSFELPLLCIGGFFKLLGSC